MSEDCHIMIDPSNLVAKLQKLETHADGDLSSVIELLLLENHVLTQHQSVGFKRGVNYGFSEYPRFLKLDDEPK